MDIHITHKAFRIWKQNDEINISSCSRCVEEMFIYPPHDEIGLVIRFVTFRDICKTYMVIYDLA